jgi:hypothetical protein
MTRCPHCGSLTEVEESPLLRWRCGVCGGPVVPSEGVQRPHKELASLVRAQRARAVAVGWTAGMVLMSCIAVMAAGLAALLWTGAHLAALVLTGIGVAAALLAIVTRGRAGAVNRQARAAVEEAWQRAASEILEARRGELTAAQLADVMRTDEAHAEVLLSGLSASGRARVDVRDDAELTYRVADAELPAQDTTVGDEQAQAQRPKAP